MKVYVITKAKPFEPETYLGIKKTVKKAEKFLRELFPYMRKTGNGAYVSGADNEYLLFIHEEELEG